MAGVQVGNRIIGADSPVTVGWENIGQVEGGPVKQFVFTYFPPFCLLAMLAFVHWGPTWLVVASTLFMLRPGLNLLLL